jgi:hypothetical protein
MPLGPRIATQDCRHRCNFTSTSTAIQIVHYFSTGMLQAYAPAVPATMCCNLTAAMDFARRIVPFWQAELGSELLGAYLIGSLAHGGFSRRYSDIDMALVTEAGLSPQALDRVTQAQQNPQQSWGFEWEPPKAVMNDSGTRDWTLWGG